MMTEGPTRAGALQSLQGMPKNRVGAFTGCAFEGLSHVFEGRFGLDAAAAENLETQQSGGVEQGNFVGSVVGFVDIDRYESS
jgi:hypothetical protein